MEKQQRKMEKENFRCMKEYTAGMGIFVRIAKCVSPEIFLQLLSGK